MFQHQPIPARIRQIYNTIQSQPAGPYYINDLARQAGLTPVVFNRYFKQMYGCTVPQCIVRAKIEQAKQLLLQQVSIKEISARLGYKQVINFHKTFKRNTRLTPGEFIRLHTGSNNS